MCEKLRDENEGLVISSFEFFDALRKRQLIIW